MFHQEALWDITNLWEWKIAESLENFGSLVAFKFNGAWGKIVFLFYASSRTFTLTKSRLGVELSEFFIMYSQVSLFVWKQAETVSSFVSKILCFYCTSDIKP